MKSSHVLKSPDSQTRLETINLMDEFWDFFERTQTSSPEEKIHIFKNTIIEPNLSCYSYVFGIGDEGLIQYINAVAPKIDILRSSQSGVLDRIQEILERFQVQFPGFDCGFATYLLPSLNLFKGIAVPSQEKIILLLGLDSLSELTDNHLKGYLTHELFHVYHFQRTPAVSVAAELALRTGKMPHLWGLLWAEGLACHAVRSVYPEIPEEEVLDWRPLINQIKPLLSDLAREARKVLTSDAPQDIAGFFYFPRDAGSNIPTGCGYYIGMLIADALAKKYPIDTLIELEDETLISEIDSALFELQEQDRSWISRRTK